MHGMAWYGRTIGIDFVEELAGLLPSHAKLVRWKGFGSAQVMVVMLGIVAKAQHGMPWRGMARRGMDITGEHGVIANHEAMAAVEIGVDRT